MNLTAQDHNSSDLLNKFAKYQRSALTEKIFIHTDKTFYLAGDVIWFKIYCTNGNSNQKSFISSVGYIELLNKDQKAVMQAKISIDRGTGDGYFSLPSSLPTGNYLIRAYTNWMKNFGPDFFCHLPVTVVNTFTNQAVPEISHRTRQDFQFFPEGGNLVAGLSSRVGFKATNEYGESIHCKGIIVDQKADTIVQFETKHAGMSSFRFTPRKAQTYYALLSVNDTIIKKELPEVYTQGYVLSVADSNDNLKVIVHATGESENLPLTLVAGGNQLIKDLQNGQILNGEMVFNVSKKKLEDGITVLTLFNSQNLPICERLYFKRPLTTMQIDATLYHAGYGMRQKVNIDLTCMYGSKPVEANMSMSVFMVDSLQKIPDENIVTYLFLTSDLKGKIEAPEYYLNSSNPGVTEATDNLMLTQGWRRFSWKSILENKTDSLFTYLPEVEGHIVTGRVVDKRSGLPAGSITGYISSPGKQFEMNSAVSNATGFINFGLKNLYSNNEFILQTNYLSADDQYRIDVFSPFLNKFSGLKLKDLTVNKSWTVLLSERHLATQVENSYNIQNRHHFYPLANSFSYPFYGMPDKYYLLDNYTRFTTMEEVMREYVINVRIRKEANKFHFKVINALFGTYFQDDPMILIDGVPVIDADKIMALDPLKIKSIGVVSHRYYLGPLTLDGIVTFRTYEGDLAGYQLDPNAVVMEYEGLQQKREFYTPKYAIPQAVLSRIPDYRNVLAWSPEINTSGDGKKHLSFYTSDIPGKFVVMVQGISSAGIPGKSIIDFTVSK